MFRIDTRLHLPSSRARLFSRVSLFDAIWAGISPALAYLVRDSWIDRPDAVAIYCGVAFAASLLVFQMFKLSEPMSRFFSTRDAVEVVKACAISVSLAGALLFTFTRMEETPRSIPLIHFFVLTAGMIGGRGISRIRCRWRDARKSNVAAQKVENIVVIGASRLAWFFIKLVEELTPGLSQIVAVLDERPQFQYRSLNGHRIAGSPLHITKIFDEYATHGIEIHKIVMAIPLEDLSCAARVEIDRISRERSINVEILPERLLLSRPPKQQAIETSKVVNEPAEITKQPFWKSNRLLNIALATVILIPVAPIAAVVAILALIDVGYPAVFWQQRVGRLGRPLHVYKFRTMRAPFDRKGNLVPESERLSRLGRFLRAARLDEIPQLWNILSGSMSLVGPRPLLPVDQPQTFSLRLQVRPGLTGLAQISGGKLISVEEKAALDEHYVRHASPFLDLKILLHTVWVMFSGDVRNEEVIAAALAESRARAETKQDFAPALSPTIKEIEPEGILPITKKRPAQRLTFARRRRETAQSPIGR
jgi:lipopolysaccharide/colanic/teichoic acid biosynthesis glycosyltransferase